MARLVFGVLYVLVLFFLRCSTSVYEPVPSLKGQADDGPSPASAFGCFCVSLCPLLGYKSVKFVLVVARAIVHASVSAISRFSVLDTLLLIGDVSVHEDGEADYQNGKNRRSRVIVETPLERGDYDGNDSCRS